MHQPVKDGLEDYLGGNRESERLHELHRHLAGCRPCRDELAAMLTQAQLLQRMRLSEPVEPAPGFYGRVLERIDSQRKACIWSLFLEPAFAKRIAFASMLLLVMFGTYMVTTPPEDPMLAASPEVILAEEEHPPVLGTDPQRDRNVVLVNLATYQE